MEDPKLREQLEQLQAEIRQTKSIDEEGRSMLQSLDADIHDLLSRSEDEPGTVQPSFIQNLQESLKHFEVSHPTLTTQISNLLDALSNAGI